MSIYVYIPIYNEQYMNNSLSRQQYFNINDNIESKGTSPKEKREDNKSSTETNKTSSNDHNDEKRTNQKRKITKTKEEETVSINSYDSDYDNDN